MEFHSNLQVVPLYYSEHIVENNGSHGFLNAYWNFILGCIGVVGLFVPFRFNYVSLISFDFETLRPFQSIEFKISGAVLLASSCPVLLDVIIDTFTGTLSETRSIVYSVSYYVDRSSICSTERLL